MSSPSFEFEPVDSLAVATVGAPGSRTFFLQARAQGQTVTLQCEKFHVQGLVTRIQEALQERAPDPPSRWEQDVLPTATPEGEMDPVWEIAELGLGYHESRGMFVIVAKERTESESEDAAVARFWTPVDRIRAFVRQAEVVIAGGRPLCGYCGLPIDPSGHPCPAANGSRPIL